MTAVRAAQGPHVPTSPPPDTVVMISEASGWPWRWHVTPIVLGTRRGEAPRHRVAQAKASPVIAQSRLARHSRGVTRALAIAAKNASAVR